MAVTKLKESAKIATKLGSYLHGDSVKLLNGPLGEKLEGKVQLILTSPPFPLNRKKKYGNTQGDDYKEWFISLAPIFEKLLTPNGSIVIELGNSWEPGRPVQSLLHLESLIGFVNNPKVDLRLCQQFVCYNPSRLPSPAQWVTIERTRFTDSYTHVWWMSNNDNPKADNKRVLRPYSESMKKLLKAQSYNAGTRPSEHKISEKSFLKNNKGSICQNVFEIEAIDPKREVRLPNTFSLANSVSNDEFTRLCKAAKIQPHPARMPLGLADFFIQVLTDEGDLVLDPFGGSNTTGFLAERSGRKWLSIDMSEQYIEQAKLRFVKSKPSNKKPKKARKQKKPLKVKKAIRGKK
jgi:DNA modification methylase